MSDISVLFDIPASLEQGLASGNLIRRGGVIQQPDGQIVAWLREFSQQERPSNQWLPDGLRQQASSLMTGQIISLAVAIAGMSAIMHRVDQLSGQIETLKAEFNHDRDVEFMSALRMAEKHSDNPENQREKVFHAIPKLYSAKQNLVKEFNEVVDTDRHLAQQYLLRIMYACTSYVRCYLEVNERESALEDITKDIAELNGYVRQLIANWLGEHPAIFLHRGNNRDTVERFLRLQHWLNSESEIPLPPDEDDIIDILENLRGDFWNQELVQDSLGDRMRQITRRPVQRFEDRLAALPDHLTQAEILLENLQRMEGFELEIRSMRLMGKDFQEWRTLADETSIEDGIVTLIPENPVALEQVQAQVL
jgi:hypothetical protein